MSSEVQARIIMQSLPFTFALLPLVMLLAQGAPCVSHLQDVSDTSGDGSLEPTSRNLENLSAGLVCLIGSLRDEHFAKDWPEESMSSYKDHKITMPHLIVEDGCFSHRFNKKRCLSRIASKLQLYRPYLDFVKMENPGSSEVDDVISRTDTLTRSIKDKLPKVEESDTSSPGALPTLPSDRTEWERKITVHVILRELGVFMAETHRAIRFINRRQ
ncbi:interleukin-6 [Brienomyrus brachyistius]|uniref:interleukin-6 n=1 Tax=Brienomyrus brachyistius TaxID=42636 RepID=UPI0020B41050|nr:interleukin-6 [Brienomyrus brachyistius]